MPSELLAFLEHQLFHFAPASMSRNRGGGDGDFPTGSRREKFGPRPALGPQRQFGQAETNTEIKYGREREPREDPAERILNLVERILMLYRAASHHGFRPWRHSCVPRPTNPLPIHNPTPRSSRGAVEGPAVR